MENLAARELLVLDGLSDLLAKVRVNALADAERVCRQRADAEMASAETAAAQENDREQCAYLQYASEAEGCANAIAALKKETEETP